MMGLLLVFVLGAIAYYKIGIEWFPGGLESKRLMVRADYENSTPLDTLEKVVEPIEDILGTITGIERIHTRAYSTSGRAYVYFHNSVDMDRAYDDIKDRMDRVLPDLPEEVEEIRVYTYDEDDEPILFSALTLGPNIDNPEYFIERYIEPALQRIDGVGDVDIKGDASREVRISLDQEKLKAHNIDVYELSRNLRDQNLNLSAGRVMEGGQEYMVRSVGRIEDIGQLQDYIVDKEKSVRLKDLGEVYISTLENYSTWRLNGGKSYGVEIMRSGNGNIVEISKAVNRVFERFENSRRWDGIQFLVFKDQGKYILESMNNLKMSALWGGVFSFIVLICFLRSIRITLTITLAIPLSLLCSVTVLYFMGWTLNILTMMGLLISIGLVIDNAIVMVENIHSKRGMGLGPKEGALKGASEISLAITMSTMTTMVVFLPLLLMEPGGEIRFYFHRIGIPVVSALAASLTIALMVIPLASKIFFAKAVKERRLKGEGCVSRIYQFMLGRMLKDRALATLILFAIIGVSLYPIINDWIETRDRSSSSGRISLRFELPAGIKKEEVAEWVDYVETFIEDNRDRYQFDSYTSQFSYASMYVYLNMAQETLNWQQVATSWFLEKIGRGLEEPMSRGDIMRDIGDRLELPPGLRMRYSYSSSGDSTRSFYLMLYGDDTETLYQLGEEVVRRISTIKELVGLDLELEENNQELNVELDREQAQQMGIGTRDVSNSISYAMRGSSVGRFYQDGRRDINIEARLQEEDRETLEALSRLTFMSDSGNEVPLQSISELDFRDAARYIRRDDRKTSMRIRALMETEDVRRTDAQIESLMEGFEMPRGYRWDRGTSYYQMDKENQEVRFALIMIFVFVLFLMGILFESFVLPLAVIGTVPIAGVGVVWMLVASDTAFERMASVGAMILIGIVVNNGIVLVDLSQRLMKQGLSRNEALIEASRRRFRPIWITSLTTIFGMVPIAIGGSKVMDMSYAPMGRVIIGGLLVSTFLTLIVVPLFYTFLDDLRNWFIRTASLMVPDRSRIADKGKTEQG